MANTIYENAVDARQAEGPVITSRFRPRYRQLSESEVTLHDDIKAQAQALEHLYSEVKDGKDSRYKALALTALEQSVMWIVKDLTG